MAELDPPVFETPGNPAPARIVFGYLEIRGGRRLRYALASPDGYARGTIVLLQGRNETIEKYFETIGDLNARGFAVATFDWRGQGGSDRLLRNGAKGHIGSIDAYGDDLVSFLDEIVTKECRRPYAILAHSMGGLVALSAMPRVADRIDRIVLSAPLVSLPDRPGSRYLEPVSRLFVWTGFGRYAVRRRPRGAGDLLETNPLTGDRRRFERNRTLAESAPQLFVPTITASWMNAMSRAIRRLDDSDVVAALQVPTLIVTAGDDRVVRSDRAERLAWRMRSGHSLNIPGARHEILQDRDLYREPFLAAFEAFVAGAMPVTKDIPPLVLTEADLKLA